MSWDTARNKKHWSQRFLRLHSFTGYVVAQAIILGFLLYRVSTNGIDSTPAYDDALFWGTVVLMAILFLIPAAVLGIFDGATRVIGKPLLVGLAAILLVLFTVLWIVPWVALWTSAEELCLMYCGPPETDIPSMSEYLGALVGAELALLSEFLLAMMISLCARWWLWLTG